MVFSQENSIEKNVNEDKDALLRERYNSALGTFQFQIVNSRIKPVVKADVIELIDKNRSENEIVFVAYSSEIRLKILPKNMISTDFEKLETFVYVPE
jgi:hypothetical protein